MKAIDLQQIELARLVAMTAKTVKEMAQICPADTEITVTENWIKLVYFGLGTEQIGLSLPESYSLTTRIKYQAETLDRLNKIKSDMLAEMAA